MKKNTSSEYFTVSLWLKLGIYVHESQFTLTTLLLIQVCGETIIIVDIFSMYYSSINLRTPNPFFLNSNLWRQFGFSNTSCCCRRHRRWSQRHFSKLTEQDRSTDSEGGSSIYGPLKHWMGQQLSDGDSLLRVRTYVQVSHRMKPAFSVREHPWSTYASEGGHGKVYAVRVVAWRL